MTYREINAANYSTLSKLSIHPVLAYEALNNSEKQTAFFDIGNYVDEGMYGNPMNSHLVIADSAIPNYDTKAREVAEFVLKVLSDNPSLEPTEDNINNIIIGATEVVGYYPNWKPATRLEKLKPVVETYINVVTDAKNENKSLITESQRELADTLISNIKNSERFKKIVEGCNILYQTPIYFKYNGILCKELPDFTLINDHNKTARILDIKTYQGSFVDNFYKFRYFYQGGFYSYGLAQQLEGHRILNPVFVAADKSLKMPIRVFEQVEWKELWSTDSSYYRSPRGGEYKTLPQLLTEYEYHMSTSNWSESYEAITQGTEKIRLR